MDFDFLKVIAIDRKMAAAYRALRTVPETSWRGSDSLDALRDAGAARREAIPIH
jgi:hypothetical protein